jgi:ATP-dependent 26S proteasome regulatory subunit
MCSNLLIYSFSVDRMECATGNNVSEMQLTLLELLNELNGSEASNHPIYSYVLSY